MATIFLVGDDLDIMTLFDKMLTNLGHKIVATAYNGEEAVDLFREFRELPDLILMDHRMTAAQEILKLNKNSKILFLSADYTIKEEALALGAKDFIEKPINFDKLLNIIEKIISEK
jgi:CheY-like chemotaxis protein